MKNWNLCFITNSELTKKSVEEDVGNAVDAGVKVIQYREKNKPGKEMVSEAKKLKSICKGRADFVVDDYLDIAIVSEADGIHIGEDDIPVEDIRRKFSGFVGYTVHSIEEAVRADGFDVDYLSLGHIFPTTTKKHTTAPLGLEVLKEAREKTTKPLGAIGGMNSENVSSAIKNGADFVSMVSEIAMAYNVKEKCEEIEGLILKAKGGS